MMPERIVIDALPLSPEFSGVGRELVELGRDLSRIEPPCQVEVRCAADVRDRLRPEFPDGTRFHTPISSSKPRFRRVLYQQLVAPFRDGRSTVLVCVGDQAPVWGRAPLVFVVNDVRRLTHPETARSRWEHLYYKTVTERGARRAGSILTISQFSQGEIERVLAPPKPVGLIGIHPATHRPRPNLDEVEPRLLVVGAIRRYKGLETVVDALSILKRSGNGPIPEVQLVGGQEEGSGPEEELRSRAAHAGVSGHLTFTGWKDDDELEGLYLGAAGTINPSTYEGYGLSVAESLARGLPTIATDIPSHREITDDCALLVRPGDAEALADAIRRLLTDPGLRERLGARGHERAERLAEVGPSWGEAILGGVASATGGRNNGGGRLRRLLHGSPKQPAGVDAAAEQRGHGDLEQGDPARQQDRLDGGPRPAGEGQADPDGDQDAGHAGNHVPQHAVATRPAQLNLGEPEDDRPGRDRRN
jgi:glycosyltransferase involved in cell wall biosynthesis